MLPIIFTSPKFEIDSASTGFLPNSKSNLVYKTRFANIISFPINLEKPNYPADYTIIFSDQILDTSIARIGIPSIPAKFKIIATPKTGGQFQANFRFRDVDGNNTLSQKDEFIEILASSFSGLQNTVLTVQVDTINGPLYANSIFPTSGDLYQLNINVPYTKYDIYRFTTDSSFIDVTKQNEDYVEKPYVVPNPYMGKASFEQAPYAQTGRGDRRIEFRALPYNSVVRIYTITGELVQTLYQDGGFQSYIAWDLRSKDNLEIAPGLYIYHVEAPGLDDFIGKFAIIK